MHECEGDRGVHGGVQERDRGADGETVGRAIDIEVAGQGAEVRDRD